MSSSNLTSARMRKILGAAELLHEHAHGRFNERLFTALDTIFEGSSQSFQFYFKDGSSTIETNVPWPEARKKELEMLADKLAPVDHPLYPPIFAGEREPLRLSDFATHRQLEQTEMYQQCLKHGEIDYQIALGIFSSSGFGGVVLNRSSMDFADDDVLVARILGNHIATAFETSNLLQSLTPKIAEVGAIDHIALRRQGLSRRESEVMLWLMEGKRDAEIAIILGISFRTVNQHVSSILAKLGAETRTAAVMMMVQRGM